MSLLAPTTEPDVSPAPTGEIFPPMDVFVAGMSRGGTTLLANLLTGPPSHWVLTEPGLTRNDMGEHVRQQAARFGFEISKQEWLAAGFQESGLARFARVLAPRLENIRWGVKEVNPIGFDEIVRRFKPRKIIIAVRNIHDCAYSLLEKHAKAVRPNPAHTEAWLHHRLLDAAVALVKLKRETPSDRVRVVRYEDFVGNPAEREALAAWLDWPLDGDPAGCLDLYGRQDEFRKHDGVIGTGSVNRRAKERRPEWIAFAERLAEATAEYQEVFGYATAPSVPTTVPRFDFGARHREKILQHVRPGTRILEWTTGESPPWLAEHLAADATLTRITHDPRGHESDRAIVASDPRVRLLLHPATAPLGQRGTIEEEFAAPLRDLVQAVAGEKFDLIVVNGLARHACLTQARDLLAPGGIIMLHDAQRAWYDDAKKLFTTHGQLGSCPDFTSAHLWWGGLTEPKPAPQAVGDLPLIVCFYTRHTDYEVEAKRLMASCEKVGLDHHVAPLDSQGSWEANCSLKAQFVHDIWRSSGRPVLWVDADAVMHAAPELLRGATADFAVHRTRGWQFASGTLFFNQTPAAGALLERWVARCRSHPRVWDQDTLDLAWEDTIITHPLETMWLPEPYCRIFDLRSGRSAQDGVVEHFQASRRLKTKISAVAPTVPQRPSLAFYEARHASRPRAALLPAADGITPTEYRLPPDARPIHPGAVSELVRMFTSHFPVPAKVLLPAAGLGSLWWLLSTTGHDVHGLAPTQNYQATTETFCPGCFQVGRPSALPHPDQSFDHALVYGTLEFLDPTELDATLGELRRVIRRESMIAIHTTPDAEPRWPAGLRSREGWETLFRHAGFDVLLSPPNRFSADDACFVLLVQPTPTRTAV